MPQSIAQRVWVGVLWEPLRRVFKASVDQLLYDDMPLPGYTMPPKPARPLLESMKDEIYESSVSTDDTLNRGSPVEELVVEESPVDISPSLSTNYGPSYSFTDVAPVRSLTPANQSLRFLETGALGSPLTHFLSSCAAVPGTNIASTDLLSLIDPLPLALHDARTIRDWPAEDKTQLLITTSTWPAGTWQN